jgi:hypothetical protein
VELKAVAGFVIIIGLLVAALAGMIFFGRPSKRRKWSTGDVGQGGDGMQAGFQGGTGSDFAGHCGSHDSGHGGS